MKLDFVLDNKSLALIVDLLWELGRDGMMSSWVLDDKTLVALDTWKDTWLLDGPLSDVSPILLTLWVILLRL